MRIVLLAGQVPRAHTCVSLCLSVCEGVRVDSRGRVTMGLEKGLAGVRIGVIKSLKS